MLKADAIKDLGGTATAVAAAIGCTPQAVLLWPDVLTPRIVDRVLAAKWRRANGQPPPARVPGKFSRAAYYSAIGAEPALVKDAA